MLQIYKKSAFIGLKGKEKVKKTAHYIFFLHYLFAGFAEIAYLCTRKDESEGL